MKKVEQTSLIDDDKDRPGDCMRASWASVLECDIEKLPKWSARQPWLVYWRNWNVFLRLKGYKAKKWERRPPLGKVPFDSFIAVGPSPRVDGEVPKHCVVYDWHGFQWDPHPGADGFDGEPDFYEWLEEEEPEFEEAKKWMWTDDKQESAVTF